LAHDGAKRNEQRHCFVRRNRECARLCDSPGERHVFFGRVEATGRPSYHPCGLLKLFTRGKVERRRAQLEKSVARYLAQLDTADLQEPSEELTAKTAHLKEKLVKLESEMQRLAAMARIA
jgi:hypothetical protein